MKMKKKKIIQVLGPTGIGKSGVAVRLAESVGGEIISADSMQVYKDFDIGTDKIKPAARKSIPHYLVDILSDCSQFNASMFLEKSFVIAEDIIGRGKVPVVCGGTALYLKTMITGIFPENKQKRVSRETLDRIVERRGLLCLWNKLNRVDPDYARQTRFQGTIAHGPMSLAFLNELMMICFGEGWASGGRLFDVRFVAPIRPGDRIRVSGTVSGVTSEKEGHLVECELSIDKGDGEKAVVGKSVARLSKPVSR